VQEPVKRAFPAPADNPTQAGPKGVKFDFNDGCRLVVAEDKAPWKVRLKDLDTGNILFETQFNAGRVNSSKRYFVRFGIELLLERRHAPGRDCDRRRYNLHYPHWKSSTLRVFFISSFGGNEDVLRHENCRNACMRRVCGICSRARNGKWSASVSAVGVEAKAASRRGQ